MSGHESLERRLERLESEYRSACPECGGGGARVAYQYLDHVDESRPEFCPSCGKPPDQTVVVDLRGDDEDLIVEEPTHGER